MPQIGQAPSVGYSPVSQSVAKPDAVAPNVIDVKGSTLDDLLTAFDTATGNPNAELLAVQGKQGLRVLVPSSSSGVPSTWTRFKAALSNLPLLGRSGTLRAARLEVSAQRANARDLKNLTGEIVSAIEQAESDESGGSIARNARSKLKTLRQTEGLTQANIRSVLQKAQEEIARPQGRQIVARAKQDMLVTRQRMHQSDEQEPTPDSSPAAATSIAPMTSHVSAEEELRSLCRQIIEEKKADSSASHEIDRMTQNLCDFVKDVFVKRSAWPIGADDRNDLADTVSMAYGARESWL